METSQLPLALALLAAAAAGSGDYFAAHASRRIPAIRVAAWAQAVGLTVVLVACIGSGAPSLVRGDLVLSLLGGGAAAIGIAGLYGALAIGPIGVTAPIAAVVGAAVPIVVDVARSHDLIATQYAGLALGLIAVALLAAAPAQPITGSASRGIVYAILGGLGMGALTIALGASNPGSGIWPLAVARTVAAVLLGLAVSRRPRPRAPVRPPWSRIVTAGALDGAAMVAFLEALRIGHMALVAVAAALYPAFTVALSTVVDHERMLRTQVAGLIIAAAAIILISWSA